MMVAKETEKQRVRVFQIEPRQLIRCLQLLADGVKFRAEPFPPTVQIVAAGMGQTEGRPTFSLVLKHDSYEETVFTNTNGNLTPVETGMPHIIFSLDETQLGTRPIVPEVQDGEASSELGRQVSQETRHLHIYQFLPYHIIRLFSLLAAGTQLQTPFFPREMTFFFGGHITADSIFYMLCEHPSFAPSSVQIERVDGVVMNVSGPLSHSTLNIDDSALD